MFRRFENLIDPFASDRLDQPPHGLLAFYWHYVGQAWRWFLCVAVTGGILAVISAVLFAYVGILIDEIQRVESPALFFDANWPLLLWIGVLVVIIEPVTVMVHMAILNQSLAPAFTSMVRWQTHRYLLRQSVAFLQNDFAGRIAQKVIQTSQAMRRSVTEMIDAVWYVSMFWVTSLAILADLDWRIAVPLVLWLLGYGLVLRYFVPRMKTISAAASEANSALTGRIVDSYTNIQTVKLFGHARHEDEYARAGIAEHNANFAAMMTQLSRFEITITVLNGLLTTGHGALVLWLWSQGELSVGSVAASFALIMRVTIMSHWIMFVASEIAENVGIVRDGADTIAQPNTVFDGAGAGPLRVERAEIRYDSVSFNYGDGALAEGRPAIQDLSLVIKPGEKVGLVGRSGAGKSTLVQLLLRLYDLDHGAIRIDGQDIAAVGQESLRARIGVVTQDTSLLHRSVLDNIRYGRPNASLSDAVAAARKAQADDFIRELRDPQGRTGYDAHVGERGVKLSGGQRQRIAIARVLLKDAPILVLDEATSALDSEVEAAIQEQLFNLMAGKTVIAIAHRLSTIAAMDRLVIMDQGQLVEQGSHEELVRQGGTYARLWARQSHGFLEDVGSRGIDPTKKNEEEAGD